LISAKAVRKRVRLSSSILKMASLVCLLLGEEVEALLLGDVFLFGHQVDRAVAEELLAGLFELDLVVDGLSPVRRARGILAGFAPFVPGRLRLGGVGRPLRACPPRS
jgi:hypothetical protein